MLLNFVSYLIFSATFCTIAERKLMASIQRRKGPNVTGFWGTLQAFADGLKLFVKDIVMPARFNWILFSLGEGGVGSVREIHWTGLVFYYFLLNGIILFLFSLPLIFSEVVFFRQFVINIKKKLTSLVTRNTFLGVVVRSGLFCSWLSLVLWKASNIDIIADDLTAIEIGLSDFENYSSNMLLLLRCNAVPYWQICPLSMGFFELVLLFFPRYRSHSN